MSNDSQEDYETQFCIFPDAANRQTDHFSPSLQSLESAQDVIRRYEKRRLEMGALNLQTRANVTASPAVLDVAIAVGDNVIPLHNPGWARPSSRLSRARHYAPPYSLSTPPRSRRASSQREAWRVSRHVRTSARSPAPSEDRAIFGDVQSGMLERLVVMAIQGLAVVLGLSGLLLLLKAF